MGMQRRFEGRRRGLFGRNMVQQMTELRQKIGQDVGGIKGRARAFGQQSGASVAIGCGVRRLLRIRSVRRVRREREGPARRRHGVHGPVLVQRQARGDQAAAARRGLHHYDPQRQPADDAVADGKMRSLRSGAGGEFAEQQSFDAYSLV